MDAKNFAEDSTDRRLESAIELAELKEHAVFALTAKPRPDARFRTLFANSGATLIQHFNNPPKLRKAGFSLEHDGNSRIIMGDLRRVFIPTWKIMELWRDGFLIYAVDGLVQPFWGSPRQDGYTRMNPLALAEPVFLFSELSLLMYRESSQVPKKIEYRARLERIGSEGNPATLSSGPLDPTSFESGERHHAPASNMDRSTTIDWNPNIDSGIIAYEIVKEIYNWFGISDDGIPYTKTNPDGAIAIDRDALIAAGTR
jgi:hypothetical protein